MFTNKHGNFIHVKVHTGAGNLNYCYSCSHEVLVADKIPAMAAPGETEEKENAIAILERSNKTDSWTSQCSQCLDPINF